MLWHKLQGAGGVGGGAIATELAYITSPATAGGTVSSFTFSNVSIGAADPNRYVVICAGVYSNTGSATFTSLTFNGSSLSGITSGTSNTNLGTNFYVVAAPTGTTANIVLNFNNTISRNGRISVYRLIHADGTPLDSTYISGSLGVSATVDTASGGAALFMGMTNSGAGGRAGTPTNYVEDVEVDIRSNEWFTSGICSAALGGSVSMSNTGQARAYAISWA